MRRAIRAVRCARERPPVSPPRPGLRARASAREPCRARAGRLFEPAALASDLDELLVMLAGEAVLVEDDGETAVRPGDILAPACGRGNGHRLHNRSEEPCVFVALLRATAPSTAASIPISTCGSTPEGYFRRTAPLRDRAHAQSLVLRAADPARTRRSRYSAIRNPACRRGAARSEWPVRSVPADSAVSRGQIALARVAAKAFRDR